MKKRMKKRKGTTLIELVVVLVMMSLFIYIVFNVFNVTYDAYNFNREFAAKMYAQTNVDNFFEIFEKELMYAGSMGNVIEELSVFANDGISENPTITNSVNTKSATIITQYALAEQLILTKKDKGRYEDEAGISPDATEKTYFALYPNAFNETGPDLEVWTLAYDEIGTPTEATTVKIIEAIPETYTIDGTEATALEIKLENIDPIPASYTYLSSLLNEISFESMKGLDLELEADKENWSGEMIYKTTIYKEASDVKLNRYIPTIDSTYTINLINNVDSFQATNLSDNFIATISYIVPEIEESTITVSRKFLKPQLSE